MDGHERKEELVKMLDYAHYYQQVTEVKLSTAKLSEKMRHICNIETDVTNVFFIQFLKYASANNLSENEIFKVIDLVENYLARRIVCNMPGNALTQVFCALHKDVLKSIEEYSSANVELGNSYSDILTYHIMHGEYNDVATDMKKKDATIEHIMPQTLNGDWKAILGDNFEEIQDKYLHTFANLTLTGINSELSNKSFEIKRDGKKIGNEIYPGYKNSKYRLTKNFTLYDKWTEIELQNRCNEIVATFLRLYSLPQTTFKPLSKPVDEASWDEETFSPTNRNLKGFCLFGNEYNETTWKGMLLQVVKLVMERYTDIVDTLYDAEGFFWSAKQADTRYCTMIAPQKYLWTSMDNRSKLRCLRFLFEKCDIAESELVLLLEPVKE